MDDETKWSMVVAREPLADGQFFYAVRTTKIFCRPTCKARLARRSNVEFFDTTAEAQAAGYRPCKRCQPLLATYRPEADRVKKACDFLDSLPENAPLPGLERLAKEVGLTKHHFHRLFKRETGFTPREYALARRRDSQSEASASTVTNISTPLTPFSNGLQTPLIANDLDFSVPVYNDDSSFDDLKLPTSQEVRQIIIYYTFVSTTGGVVLVAFRDRKVCRIEFGMSEQELMALLEMEFPSLYHVYLPIDDAGEQDAEGFRKQTNDIVDGLENSLLGCGLDPTLAPEVGELGVLDLDDQLLSGL